MKTQRLLIVLTVFNLGLLMFLLLGFRFLPRSFEASSVGSVLRGRALEITDDEGRVRASIKLYPSSVLPDGTTYPATVLLRLVDSQGRPNVKLAAITDTVRREGFAWIDGQVFHGYRAIAAPIFDTQGVLQAAMSLVSNQASLVKFPNSVVDDLLATAKRASQRLGWQP